MGSNYSLRKFQEVAINSCRTELSIGNKRIVLYAPTGAGKSVMAEALTNLVLGRGKRVAIIANRVQLVKQMAERFAASGIEYGVLQGQNTVSVHKPVVLCSINTVAKRGLPDADLIIIDEGHAVAGSRMYRDVLFRMNNVPVIALTATPFSKGMAKKYEELGNEPLFQKMVIAETISGLIKLGFLVDCEIYAPSEPDLTGVKMTRNSFGEYDYSDMSKELAEAVDKPQLVGDIVAHWHKLAEGKPTICFATSIPHSHHIVEQFKADGISAQHIDCYMKEEEKEQILSDFKSGKFTVLSNCALLAEGFDYPACEVMILARPTKSLIRYIQMVGRILRPFHGKDRGLLLDHSGSVKDLGFPTDDLPLVLDDGSAQKQQKKEKQEAKPKKCPKCSYMKPPKVSTCPKCGFKVERPKDEIEHEDGELVKFEKAQKAEKQDFYSQLIYVCESRGYSEGWVANNYKDKFGVWPRGLEWTSKEPSIEVSSWIKHKQIKFAKGKEKREALGRARLQTLKDMVASHV